MAMPQETKTARNVRPLETALDVFNTQLNIWGIPTGSLLKKLGVAYENSILFGEHTWGAKLPGWGFAPLIRPCCTIEGQTEYE
jgi:alpha-mannosidase